MVIVLIEAVDYFFRFAYILILIRVILTWMPMAHNSRFAKILFALTEPILAPIRNVIRKSPLGGQGMILDFSPIIAFLILSLLRSIVITLLIRLV